MIESLFSGLAMLTAPIYIALLMLGMSIGIVIGIIPGLGGSVGLAIVLPFIVAFEPGAGIAMLIGLIAVTTTSDTITCVLLGIPGTGGSMATKANNWSI